MAPLLVLVVTTLVARAAGAAGLGPTATWPGALAVGLAAMFALTASAHFSRRRAGLVAIVPPGVPHPAAAVTLTGVLEALGAVGLLVPPAVLPGVRSAAAACLALLLVALFPANVHAARERRHPDAPHTPLGRRTAMQAAFLAAAVTVAVAST